MLNELGATAGADPGAFGRVDAADQRRRRRDQRQLEQRRRQRQRPRRRQSDAGHGPAQDDVVDAAHVDAGVGHVHQSAPAASPSSFA